MPELTKIKYEAKKLQKRLQATIQELVQIPSENTPPSGAELGCQQYLQSRLEQLGIPTNLYQLDSIAGLTTHPAFRHQRDYQNRPNLAGILKGTGGGKSLLLSGHIDTVPRGTEKWRYDPFGGIIEGKRLYGLGSNDMKGGIAASIIALEAILATGVKLRGDVIFESIVDEEFGGVNGTLAARVAGYNADAAIITEPTQNVICPGHLGGRIIHIILRSPDGGILEQDGINFHLTDQLHYLLGALKDFAEQRKQRVKPHSLYAHNSDHVPVWVTKIHYGGWGTNVPTTIPNVCRIELYWQQMPGEDLADVDAEFFNWLNFSIKARPELFPIEPETEFAIEWLPGSAMGANESVVQQLAATFTATTGKPATIQGLNAPCDMFVFHQHFHTPALLFGPIGGNTHLPDEWVDLDSAQNVAETLASFIYQWCA